MSSIRPRALAALAATHALAAAAACGKDGSPEPVAPGGPGPTDPNVPPAGAHAGVNFAIPVALDDTIESETVFRVVAYLRDASNRPVVNAHVFFTRRGPRVGGRDLGAFGFCGYDPIRCVEGRSGSIPAEVDSTDADGRVSTLIRMSATGGDSYLILTAAQAGLVDSTPVHVRAGTPTSFVVEPADTALYVGAAYAPRGVVLDRRLNPTPAASTFTADGATLGSSGPSVTALRIGRGSVVAKSGAFVATAAVSVVPPGRIAAATDSAVVLFALDGSAVRRIATTPSPVAFGTPAGFAPRWIGAESRLVVSLPVSGVSRLFAMDTTGALTRLGGAPASRAEIWPEAAADGWIYFNGYPFTSDGSTVPGLYRTAAQGGAAATVVMDPSTNPSLTAMGSFSHSPDGSLLAYTVVGAFAVYDLAAHRVLMTVPGKMPRFSPDGRRIAFIDPASRVHTATLDGDTQDVGCTPSCTGPLDWSPDGRWIIAVQAPSGLRLLSTTSSLELPLAFTAGLTQPAWKP